MNLSDEQVQSMKDAKAPRCGKGKLLAVSEIVVEKDRGRKVFDVTKLQDLGRSIEKHGLLHPLVVSLRPSGKFTLISGERRFRAMLLKGYTFVPVAERSGLSPLEQKEIELEENLQREGLEWTEEVSLVEQADAIKRQIHGEGVKGSTRSEDRGWTQQKTADALGKSRAQVQKEIALAKLMKERPDIKKRIKKLPMATALKVSNRILEGERLERLSKAGSLKVDSTLVMSDALSWLQGLKDDSVDLLLTDPPFGIEDIQDGMTDNHAKDKAGRATAGYKSELLKDDNMTEEQVIALLTSVMPEIFRVLKPGRHFYIFHKSDFSQRLRELALGAGLEASPVPLIWYKKRTTSPFRGYDYQPCYEPILVGYKPPRSRHLNNPAKTVLEFSPPSAKEKIHPFEKPQELLRFLINQSTNLGERVIDPFAGSGSTILAAKATGRSGHGCEKEPEHFLIAQARLVLDGRETNDDA